jgi:hypothetical protein
LIVTSKIFVIFATLKFDNSLEISPTQNVLDANYGFPPIEEFFHNDNRATMTQLITPTASQPFRVIQPMTTPRPAINKRGTANVDEAENVPPKKAARQLSAGPAPSFPANYTPMIVTTPAERLEALVREAVMKFTLTRYA